MRHLHRNVGSCKKRTVLLPLVAALASGCIPDTVSQMSIECKTGNSTTVKLDVATDGKIAPLKDSVAEPGRTISKNLAKTVAESHGLSTEGLPSNTTATITPDYCFDKPGEVGYAFTTTDSSRGTYFPTSINVTDGTLFSLYHEAGHLQPGGIGNEVIPETNVAEQRLMMFPLLAGSQKTDSLAWAFYSSVFALETKLASIVTQGITYDELNKYDKARIFIFEELTRLDGDFSELRAESRGFSEAGLLELKVEKRTREFLGKYSNDDLSVARIVLTIRQIMFDELRSRFGNDAAMRFFDSNSHFIWEQGNGALQILTLGLENLNCVNKGFPGRSDVSYRCNEEQTCRELGVDYRTSVSARLYCIKPDGNTFKGFEVLAEGTDYARINGESLEVDGNRWKSVQSLRVIDQTAVDQLTTR